MVWIADWFCPCGKFVILSVFCREFLIFATHSMILMKTTEEYLELLRAYKALKAIQYGILRIGIFGSVSRGEQTPQSDVDIFVELKKQACLFLCISKTNCRSFWDVTSTLSVWDKIWILFYVTVLHRREFMHNRASWEYLYALLVIIIAHHYFDLDAEIVYDVVKNDLPEMLITIRKMIVDLRS